MKSSLGRMMGVFALGMVVCYGAAAVIACTSVDNCRGHSKPVELTLIQERASIPATITELEIQSIIHDIDVKIGEGPEGKLVLDNPNNPKTGSKEFTLKVEGDDKRMSVVVDDLEDFSNMEHVSLDPLRLTVTLPADFNGKLVAKTVSGDIVLPSLTLSFCDFSSTSGDLSASKLACGNVTLKTTSGDYKVGEIVAKEFTFGSISGEGTFMRTSIDDSAQVNTVSGDIELEFSKVPTQTISSRLVSGDLLLTFPPSVKLDVSIESTSGSITSKVPITTMFKGEPLDEHSVKGTVGGEGGPKLEVRTVSGDVEMR